MTEATVTFTSASGTIAGHSDFALSAACADSTYAVTGGGYNEPDADTTLVVISTAAVNSGGIASWRVSWYNPSASTFTYTSLTVSAQCLLP